MGWWQRVKSWLWPEEPRSEIHPDRVLHPDQLAREAIARAFNTGNIVIANRDELGNVTIRELPKEDAE